MRNVIGGSVACALFGFGCASTPAANVSPPVTQTSSATASARAGLLVWIEGGKVLTVEVNGAEVFGSTVNLRRSMPGELGPGKPGQLQGIVDDRQVSVVFYDDRASGVLNGQPFNLYMQGASEGTIEVRGLVGGALSSLEIGPTKLTGHVGSCGYELTGDERLFDGYRSCGGHRQRTRVEVGNRFATWSPLEKATLLALLLRG